MKALISCPFLLLSAATLFGQSVASDSTVLSNDSLHHSISGFELYFEDEGMQQFLLTKLPVRSVQRLTLLHPGSYYLDRGEYYSFDFQYGENAVLIDGMRVKDPSAFPFRSIARSVILSNQMAIQLGNSAAGFILIESPALTDSFSAEVEFLTSEPFHSLGDYVLDFNIGSPIKLRKESRVRRTLLPSFFLSVQLSKTNDFSPSQPQHYSVNEATLNNLETAPLIQSPVSDAFIPKSEVLTDSVFEESDFADAPQKTAGAFMRLNIPISESWALTAGSYFQFDKRKEYIHAYELFNEANYPETTTRNFDNYLRVSNKMTIRSNFQINQEFQFNFSNYYLETQSPMHQNRFFDYGYIGTYDILREPVFSLGEDDVTGNFGWLMIGYQDTLVTFTPATQNPLLTNYTNTYYDLAGENKEGYYETLDQIRVNGGLLNGGSPRTSNNLWYNTGTVFNNYAESINKDIDGHYLFNLSFNKSHHVKVGAEFTKSRQAYYKIAPVQLWTLMRELANRHLDELDTDNPYLLINGEVYNYNDPNAPAFGQNDSILYDRKYDAGRQTHFDRSLREKLGLPFDNTDYINTDSYGPDFYSLNMFSADELLNNGNLYADWMGYDYLSSRPSKKISAEDYFYMQDATGSYVRPVKAYEPNYFSAYSEYQFYSKWIDVIAGLRIDRFDANQPVLRDEYSLYRIKTVNEMSEINGVSINHPSNIEGDAAVYVDDKGDPTHIAGYRSGDTWYSADGSETNPIYIAQESVTGRINPLLENPNENIKSPDFDFNGSFKDYEPAVNVLPHLQLVGKPFKITRVYFRYFSVAENPEFVNWFHPGEYFFFAENFASIVFNNPALKPTCVHRIIAGANQKIYGQLYADVSYYRHIIKNSIGIKNVTYAYPADYVTFTNLSKETSQGIVTSLSYRSPKNSGVNAAVYYNWQWDADIEHVLNTYLQFNFGYGNDYIGFKTRKDKTPLEGLGLGIFCHLRQGMRYTKQANPTGDAFISQDERRIFTGALNGEQLPLFYFLDFKVEKGFSLASGKVQLSVYLWIQNLLNTKNILDTYPYTGKSDDDGYLASPIGQQDVSSQIFPEAFANQYNTKLQDPAYFDAPRIIRWGVLLSFR